MKGLTFCLLLLQIGAFLAAALAAPAAVAAQVRIKDLVEIDGVRGNDLVGYGLVVGLNGTGDGLRNSPFTEEAMSSLLERLGVNVTGEQFRPKNVAAVLVTAALPPFARSGGRIDITVSTIGDAKSLLGGTLVMTPLNAADGQIYAVAQGSIIAGGASASGSAETTTIGVPTAGVIPNGARIEREIGFSFDDMQTLRLALRDPDFTTAARIERAINDAFRAPIARMLDSGTVQLRIDPSLAPTAAHLISLVENIAVEPEQKARVVVDQRSGTVVLGSDVRISPVAVAQGGLTLRVSELPAAVQPNPFSDGETIVLPRTETQILTDPGTGIAYVEGGVSLPEVIEGLNALGVAPQDLINILKAIKSAGALHAEFIVQ